MPSTSPVTVLIARFEDLFAAGLRVLLDTDAAIEVVAMNIAPRRISVVLSAHHPDVAILDADKLLHPAEVRELLSAHPQTRLVLFSRDGSASASALLAFGASACLDRDAQARDLLNAVHLAARGLQVSQSPNPARLGAHATPSQRLTPREAELLPLLQRGDSNAQIALALGIGVETVRTHAHNLYGKLGVSSRRELSADVREPAPHAPPPAARAGTVSRALGPRGLLPRGRRGHGLNR